LKPQIRRLLNNTSPAMAYIFHMRLSAHACKAQSRSCRKAESQYGKIHYVSQPPMTTWKETLGVPMYYNSVVCRRKETKPWTASNLGQQVKYLPLLNVKGV
jgi:hypothetical protein